MSTPSNWRGGAVPPAGATVFIPPTAGDLDNDIVDFKPSSITFLRYGTGEVTIGGNDITGVTAITNLSTTSSHTINAKVRFAGNIQVSQDAMGGDGDLTKAHVTFAGGAYAEEGFALESANSDPVYSRCIFGEYFLANAANSPWTVTGSTSGNGHRRNCLAPNSILHVPYAGKTGTIYIDENAKLVVGNQTVTSDRLSYRNYGQMVVTNLTVNGGADTYVSHGQGTEIPGVFKFNSVTNSVGDTKCFYLADANIASKHEFCIGEGGLDFSSGSKGSYCIGRSAANNYETIRPWDSNFTIADRDGKSASLFLNRDVEFCTDDESGTGRTITVDAITCATNTPTITISGKGTLKINKAAQNAVQPPITLKDSATLEYGTATASLGTGAITLGAGTTFAFQNGGRELSMPSAIALPSTDTATLRIDGARLCSGDHTVMSGVAADAADHLTLHEKSAALDGRKGSLRVVKQADDSYNLILDITPVGTMFMVY